MEVKIYPCRFDQIPVCALPEPGSHLICLGPVIEGMGQTYAYGFFTELETVKELEAEYGESEMEFIEQIISPDPWKLLFYAKAWQDGNSFPSSEERALLDVLQSKSTQEDSARAVKE